MAEKMGDFNSPSLCCHRRRTGRRATSAGHAIPGIRLVWRLVQKIRTALTKNKAPSRRKYYRAFQIVGLRSISRIFEDCHEENHDDTNDRIVQIASAATACNMIAPWRSLSRTKFTMLSTRIPAV